jgi:hypothetical protein
VNDAPAEIRGHIPFKTLLVDAVAGAGFPDLLFAERCARLGVAEWVDAQGAGSWGYIWLKGQLYETMPEEELQLLYYSIKNYTSLTNPGAPA